MNRIPFITFARGVLILGIVAFHVSQRMELPGLVQQAFRFGGTGIHLFFLISGFGLAYSFKPGNWAAFYRRRLTKVWLPYVLALTCCLLAALAFHLYTDGFGAWLAGVAMYQLFFERYIASFGGHFWYISTTLQFYLVFPVLHRWYTRVRNPWLFTMSALVISMLWWFVVFALDKVTWRTWNSFFLQFLWEFAAGMAIAGVYRQKGDLAAGWLRRAALAIPLLVAVMVVSLAIMAALQGWLGENANAFNDIPGLVGYAAFCLIAWMLCRQWAPWLERSLNWVGEYSYALYLVHILTLDLYIRVLKPIAPWHFAFFFPLALVAAWIFEHISRRWVSLFESRTL